MMNKLMMNKTMIALSLLSATVLFTACDEKDGAYKCDRHIADIYCSSEENINGETTYSTSEAKYQHWTWDGKKLSEVVTYDEDGSYETEKFTYDKKDRILSTKIISSVTGAVTYTSDYQYNDKCLENITVKQGSKTVYIMSFEYTDKKITSISIFSDDELDKVAVLKRSPLRFLVSNDLYNNMISSTKKCVAAAAKTGSKSDNLSYKLTWKGDNVSTMVTSVMGLEMTIRFTYDNKTNPYYNCYSYTTTIQGSDVGFNMMSKNNITSASATFFGETMSATAKYTYDGDFPVSIINESPFTSDDVVYNEETGEYEDTTVEGVDILKTRIVYSK